MIKLFLIKSRKHKTLIQNFTYISLLEGFTLLIPLITYPYLIRIIGKNTYGLVVFSQAIIGYLALLVNFGFNISATKEISLNRNNNEKLSEIVSSVLIIKAILFLFSCFSLMIFVRLTPSTRSHILLYFLTLWICLYEVIFPIWYFQGIEKMKFITYINLTSRLIFIGLMFLFIHSPKDYIFHPIANGIGVFVAGIASLYIVFKKHGIKFIWPSVLQLRYYFNASLPIFISYLSSKIYYGSNRVIIGSFIGMAEVAYYDLGEKIVQVLKIPQSILSQALFPKVSIEKDMNFIRNITKISVTFHLIILVLTIIFSKFMVEFLGGVQMRPAYLVLNLLSITIPIVATSNIFGTQILIPFGYSKDFRNVVVSSAILYILLFAVLWSSSIINIISISILTIIIELYIMTLFIIKCKQNSLWVKKIPVNN